MNPLNVARTRCIDIRYKWIIEQAQRNRLKVAHVKGIEMAADGLTKPLMRPPGQPDIGYTPDHDKYLERARRRQEEGRLSKALPPGFPPDVRSKLVWDGNDLAETYDWNYHLTEQDSEEIESAVRYFQGLGKPLGFIKQETFPLPHLHKTLRGVSHEIHNGHGFKVIKGVPVTKYTREENIIIYAGISAHVAPIRGRQDSRHEGHPADVVLAHIKDLTASVDASNIGAPAYTADQQVFHTDVGDIIALFALGEAAEGGQSYLSSSWKVYNELAATRPDLIQTLSEPWAADTFGKLDKPYTLASLLHFQPATDTDPERLIIQYARRSFTGAIPGTASGAQPVRHLRLQLGDHRRIAPHQRLPGDHQEHRERRNTLVALDTRAGWRRREPCARCGG
ncbi:Clavaminate synthase-like protein [Parathielavia hyrcaniae]|uniref:Clavaminate synthase-like protein n=1 Tax=Parathielavia hyrcaniae TaxID=113614 RepID=A0AAN6T0S1_9PEZI|nr:Clavaminate synthase-like protein [Parathielavia hyrcaniae]